MTADDAKSNAARMPWSVKGIEPEIRQLAKIAARRRGMTIGGWLTEIIRAAAVDSPDATGSAGTTVDAESVEAVQTAMSELMSRVETLETRMDQTLTPLARAVVKIAERLDQLEYGTGELDTPDREQRFGWLYRTFGQDERP